MDNTCPHCGYARTFCICGKKRNTSGDVQKFQNYEDYTTDSDNYAMTAKFKRPLDKHEKKFLEELNPINGEELSTWLKRSDLSASNLCGYAHSQHLWGTSKGEWACHRTSRYCFICTSIQHIQILRIMGQSIFKLLPEHPSLKAQTLRWDIQIDPDTKEHTYSIY